jgi:hypothetical protein
MRHPALSNVAIDVAVGIRVALYAMQRLFDIIEETMGETGLLFVIKGGLRRLLPWLLRASAASSCVFTSQLINDHGAVQQRGLAAIDFRATAPDFLQPFLRDNEVLIEVQAFKQCFRDEGASRGFQLHGFIKDFLRIRLGRHGSSPSGKPE